MSHFPSQRNTLWLAAIIALALTLAIGLPTPASAAPADAALTDDAPIYPGTARIQSATDEPGKCKDCEPIHAVNPAVGLSSGGPDEFGYTFADSNESGGPVFDYVDITSTGANLSLFDDSAAGPFAIGFDFEFYGEVKEEFYIGSNGLIGFSPVWLSSLGNTCPIVNQYTPNDIIALQWDDLLPGYSGGIYYETFDTCPYGGNGACLVVQYTNIYYYFGGSAGDFEAILFDDGDILIQFAEAGDRYGAYSTTGIEDATGSDGLTFACNQSYSLTNELAILFSNDKLAVNKSVEETLPLPGTALTFTVHLNNELDATATAVNVDDLLPPEVTLAGPVTISPDHPEATLAQSSDDLPSLVAGLTLTNGESVEVTVPTLLSDGISGARINQVFVDSPSISETVSAEVGFYAVGDCESAVDNPIENCGFETGDFTGWITSEISIPLLPLQVAGAGVDTRYGQFVSAPSRGEYAAVSGFDGSGPGAIKIAQDVALPTDATTLEFAYRIGYDLSSYANNTSRQFVVEVEPEGGGPYPLQRSVVYIAESGLSMADSGGRQGQVDVSDYAGTSVRLIFRLEVPEVNSGPAMFQLDNIAVRRAGPPVFANSAPEVAKTGEEYRHIAIAMDSDVGDTISFTLVDAGGANEDTNHWLMLEDRGDGTALLSGWPGQSDLGDHVVTIVATDNRGLASQQTFAIAVEEGPDPYRYETFVPIYASALN